VCTAKFVSERYEISCAPCYCLRVLESQRRIVQAQEVDWFVEKIVCSLRQSLGLLWSDATQSIKKSTCLLMKAS